MAAGGHTAVNWSAGLAPLLHALEPLLPILIPLLIFAVVLTAPLPGRGPTSRRRDPWRTFKYDARAAVMGRAGHRCEGVELWFGLRCRARATEADHIYPWSKGGGTVLSNGQALCHGHNRRKGSKTPPWWRVLLLERRRRSYFPEGVNVRVDAALPREVRAAHSANGIGRGPNQPQRKRGR